MRELVKTPTFHSRVEEETRMVIFSRFETFVCYIIYKHFSVMETKTHIKELVIICFCKILFFKMNKIYLIAGCK